MPVPTCVSYGQTLELSCADVHCGVACGSPTSPGGRFTTIFFVRSSGTKPPLPLSCVLNLKLTVESGCAPACVVEIDEVNVPGVMPNSA